MKVSKNWLKDYLNLDNRPFHYHQVTIHRRTECITSKAEDLSFALLAVIPFLFSLLGFMKDLCDRIRISCTQTIQCVYLVDTISAAGLYVCPDQCIIICGLH